MYCRLARSLQPWALVTLKSGLVRPVHHLYTEHHTMGTDDDTHPNFNTVMFDATLFLNIVMCSFVVRSIG